MGNNLRPYAWIGYLVGALGLLAAGAFRLVFGTFDIYSQASLAAALVGLAAALIVDPERVQRWLTGRQARYGGNALVMTLAFLGILVVLNVLGQDISQRWDLTEDKEFTLTTESIEILEGLPEPVTVTGFFTGSRAGQQERAEGLLEQYKFHSDGRLTYRFVDPQREPAQAQAAQITQDGELVLESGGHMEHVTGVSVNEEGISTALLKLSDPVDRTVYFLTGEGQRSLEESGEAGLSQVKTGLERLNFTVNTLSLLISPTVPADASVVIIAAPTQPLSQAEVTTLDEYLNSGGGLVYLSEPLLSDPEEESVPDPLVDYLDANWGISVQDDLVLDTQSLLGPPSPIVDPASGHGTYGPGPITEQLGGLATIFFSARSLETRTVEDRFINPVHVVETASAPGVWGETDILSLVSGQPAFDEISDNAGPVTLAVSAQDNASGARVVVFGDVDFASNAFTANLGNGELFYSAANWASGQENLLSLPPRDRTNRIVVPPSTATANLILLVTVFGMPLAVLVSGGVVWYQRRRHG